MEKKSLLGVEIKDADKGIVHAIFSRLNVKDHDGDVTVPGAFEDGAAVRISAWNHASWGGVPAVGRGKIRAGETEALLEGKFFMSTEHGRETFLTVKEMGDLQEWSYGFDVLEEEKGEFEGEQVRFLKRLKVHEVSPVLVGAGVETETSLVKSLKTALRPHSTPTTDAEWDGGANVARIPDDAGASVLRQMYAWVDPDADPDTKAAYRFPHHMVSEGGEVGAANVRANIAIIARLNQSQLNNQPWWSDRDAIWQHAARHLRDADREPAELRSKPQENLKFAQELAEVTCAVYAAIERAKAIAGLREKDGRDLPASRIEQLNDLKAALGDLEQFLLLRSEDTTADQYAALLAEVELVRAKTDRVLDVVGQPAYK